MIVGRQLSRMAGETSSASPTLINADELKQCHIRKNVYIQVVYKPHFEQKAEVTSSPQALALVWGWAV